MRHHAKGRAMAQPSHKSNGLSMETKVEVIRVQMDNLVTSFNEFRDEYRRGRDEQKQEIGKRIERLENETLDAGKMMIGRIEKVEQTDIESKAVTADRKWLLTVGVAAIGSLLVQAYTFLKPFLLHP